MRALGIALAAFGLGAFIGVSGGDAMTIPAASAAFIGLLLILFRKKDSGTDLITPGSAPAPKDDRPTLSGLGTRVEHILQLAEEQAADHKHQARLEADRIIAEAEVEAEKRRHLGES